MLAFTSEERLIDAQGRPRFLWDCDMTEAELRAGLASPDPDERAYLLGKVMRQAKPDDVFRYVTLDEVVALWDRLLPHLGRRRAFWEWIVPRWVELRRAG